MEIKFKHNYLKLPDEVEEGSEVKLVRVEKTNLSELSQAFLEYDTGYIDPSTNTKKYYNFTIAYEWLVLYFTINGKLFTTIRPHDPDKYDYYKTHIGEMFKVIFNY